MTRISLEQDQEGLMRTETWRRFEGEARVAATPEDARHCNPVFPAGARVISVGCGGGWPGETRGASRFVGVDIDELARAFRRARGHDAEFRLARGEELPFADAEFSFYMARVSLMYMDLPRCLREAYRVLEDHGELWITCHDFAHTWAHLRASMRALRLKDIVYRTYVLGNGLLLHCCGRVVRYPFKRSRIESFQTRRGVRRALAAAGFVDIAFPSTPHGHFLVTARKPPANT